MSGETANIFTNTNTLPKYVVDETLKRARTEDGSAIRVAVSSSATDLAPITSALGTQQDPAETPTVIGLLKNLIANGGGGGGGGSSTYPVMKTQLNYISFVLATAPPYSIQLSTCLHAWNDETIPATIPDWAKGMLIFKPGFGGWCLVYDRSGDGYGKFSYLMGSPTDGTLTHESFSLTVSPTGTNDWNIIVDEYSASNYYDLADSSNNSYSSLYKQFSSFWAYVIFFDPDPLEISGGGGGGGGESITTYSFTLNNVNVTDITAPETDPPSSSDKTLVSKSYVDASLDALKAAINDAHLQRRTLLLTGQMTTLTTGTTYNLPSTFNITIPSWTRTVKIGFQIGTIGTTQGYLEFGSSGGTFSDLVVRASNGDLYGFNYTYDSGNFTINKMMKMEANGAWTTSTASFSLISITVYGNFSF